MKTKVTGSSASLFLIPVVLGCSQSRTSWGTTYTWCHAVIPAVVYVWLQQRGIMACSKRNTLLLTFPSIFRKYCKYPDLLTVRGGDAKPRFVHLQLCVNVGPTAVLRHVSSNCGVPGKSSVIGRGTVASQQPNQSGL